MSAIILTDGFYYGQTSSLTPVQFISISYLFNYFGDYELPYNDGMVSSADFIRAVQDGSFPYIYNSMTVDRIFVDMKDMSFFAFA